MIKKTVYFQYPAAQILTGLPTMISVMVQGGPESTNITHIFGRGVDLGQVYAGVAGLLNLMCILDVIVPKSSAKQEATMS